MSHAPTFHAQSRASFPPPLPFLLRRNPWRNLLLALRSRLRLLR